MDNQRRRVTVNPQTQHLGWAITLICLSALSYAISSIFVKLATTHTNTNFIVFFRYGFFLIFLIPLMLKTPKRLVTANPLLQIARGIFGMLSIATLFYAVQYVNLAQAIVLSVSTPLFIPIVLRLTRNIKIIHQLYWGMTLGFLGIILILHPWASAFHIALLIALASAIFRALSTTFIRQISKSDSPLTIMFYYFLVGTIVSGVSLIINPQPISHLPWLYLVMIGITGAFYQVFMTLAYKLAPVRLISPFTYLTVVFAAIADWLIWDQTLSALTIVGIVLVFAGAMLTVYIGKKHIN